MKAIFALHPSPLFVADATLWRYDIGIIYSSWIVTRGSGYVRDLRRFKYFTVMYVPKEVMIMTADGLTTFV